MGGCQYEHNCDNLEINKTKIFCKWYNNFKSRNTMSKTFRLFSKLVRTFLGGFSLFSIFRFCKGNVCVPLLFSEFSKCHNVRFCKKYNRMTKSGILNEKFYELFETSPNLQSQLQIFLILQHFKVIVPFAKYLGFVDFKVGTFISRHPPIHDKSS